MLKHIPPPRTNEFRPAPSMTGVASARGCQAQSESNGGGVSLARMDHCAPAPRVRPEIICRDRQSLKVDIDVVGWPGCHTDALKRKARG